MKKRPESAIILLLRIWMLIEDFNTCRLYKLFHPRPDWRQAHGIAGKHRKKSLCRLSHLHRCLNVCSNSFFYSLISSFFTKFAGK